MSISSEKTLVFKHFVKDHLPKSLIILVKKIYSGIRNRSIRLKEWIIINQTQYLHAQAIKQIYKKEGAINVVFFALFDSVWKYDQLYHLMDEDSRFNPIILVCPIISYGREDMLLNMEKSSNLFLSRGYNVMPAYNPKTRKYVDVRTELKPDVIFYTNPYKGLIDDRYYIDRYPDILTCYTPYGINECNEYKIVYDSLLENLVWKHYLGFTNHIRYAKEYSRVKGRNTVYSGFPGVDRFIHPHTPTKDVWKIKDRNIKRIIWAPHHTITDYAFVHYSTFLEYCDFMFEMAQKYENNVQIAFKPHPLLRNRLELMWGKEKTLEYYSKWENLPNGILNNGAYEDLFLTSDAIIHDSGSFICEYLYTGNPAMFLSNGKEFNKRYNDFAQDCLKRYYIGKNKDDIEQFILNIITGTDSLKKDRHEFIKTALMPPNGKTASENIIDDLINSLHLPNK